VGRAGSIADEVDKEDTSMQRGDDRTSAVAAIERRGCRRGKLDEELITVLANPRIIKSRDVWYDLEGTKAGIRMALTTLEK
jgi:hypothetical protein